MSEVIIEIESVEREGKIGSVFNEIFNVVNATDSVPCGINVKWDFKKCVFLHPFYIAALAFYKDSISRRIDIINVNNYTARYFEITKFKDLFEINDVTGLNKLSSYRNKTYIPLCKFQAINENTITEVTNGLQNLIETQIKPPAKIKTPLSYMISELVCNIREHSRSTYGYMFAQFLRREKCLNLCIADSGISIYNSYLNTNKYIDVIGDDEGIAIQYATNGKSTKNLPNAENRGYGLPTTKQMLVEGLHGSFFILSGSAFHRHDIFEKKSVNLPKNISWQGTIILLKIPLEIPKEFRYEDYIE